MKEEIRTYLKKKRKRDKREKLGLIERLKLNWQARVDGKNGLPAQYENDAIYSSTIDKELRSFDESLKEMESTIMDYLENYYIEIYHLKDSITKTRIELEILEKNSPEAADNKLLTVKKAGEERMTEAQIHNRRKSEYEKRVAPYYSRRNALNSKLSTDIDRLIHNASIVKHAEDEAVSIEEKMYDHVYQRLDYYWNKCYPYRRKDIRDFPPAIPLSTIELFTTRLDEYIKKSVDRKNKVEKVLEDYGMSVKEVA